MKLYCDNPIAIFMVMTLEMQNIGPAIFHIDAFTDRLFSGNQAGVCILPQPCDELWMQKVAAEMNLSETAFLNKQKDGFNLRWFTPVVEVDLCGHATLARPEEQTVPPPELARALGVTPKYIGRNRFDYLVEVDSEKTLRNLKPDFHLLGEIPARGVIVTSIASTFRYDFISRFFAPGVGVNEDAVTGSSHCCLGPFWKNRIDKSELVAYQASGRGGIVHVRVCGNRVYLSGTAVTVSRGELVCLL